MIAALKTKAAAAATENVSAVVGYTAAYAIYVHENLLAKHAHGKQAKFLEQPARELAGELALLISESRRKGKTMGQALLIAGLRLQRESMMLVPIDTGNLRGSAFTRLESK